MSTHDPAALTPPVPPAAADPLPAALATADHLPDDPAYLKHLIIDLVQLLQQTQQENAGLRDRINELLRRLLRLPRSQDDPNQLLLFPELREQLEQAAAAAGVDLPASSTEPAPKKKKKQGQPHGRGQLPAHLERVRIEHGLSAVERACPCCGLPRAVLSAQTSEQLDYRPAALFVNEHVRFTYICTACEPGETPADTAAATDPLPAANPLPAADPAPAAAAPAAPEPAAAGAAVPCLVDRRPPPAGPVPHTLSRAPRPAAPIDRGLPGPGLLAYVAVSKFADHLPLYRLETILSRLGVQIARSTMCDWLAAGGTLVKPVVELFKERLLQSHVIHTDDTSVRLRDRLADELRRSRLWVYIGDRRQPYTVFDYTRTRQRDGPNQFLLDYHGFLQADAYAGYDGLYLDPQRGIRELACWAHARRKFDAARSSAPVRAAEALAFIRCLYDVEDEALALAAGDPERLEVERWRLRQLKSLPLLEKFHIWLLAQRDLLLPKHPLNEAVGYALNNWAAFVRYTEDGATAIDNNLAERTLRRVGIGRKNYLFFGADSGGHTAALWYSLMATCDRHQVEPWYYLCDVLARLAELREPLRRAAQADDAAARVALLEPLLPDVWKQTYPEAHVPDVHNLGSPHRHRR